MKTAPVVIAVCIAAGGSGAVFACGPFFAETLLNEPKATLRVPIVSFESEVRQVRAPSAPPAVAKPLDHLSEDSAYSYDRTIERDILTPETKELEGILAAQPEADRKQLVSDYRALRTAMLRKYWNPTYFGDYITVPEGGYELLAQAELGHWPKGLPEDIVLYLQGALLYDHYNRKGAIETWKKLLDLPTDQRRNRSVAAAWMIAKATREEQDLTAAQPWYDECVKLSTEGYRDCLQLGLSALGWQARQLALTGEDRKALELYYHQALAGDLSAWNSLRRIVPTGDDATPGKLDEWARDPFLRGLITAQLLGRGPSNYMGDPDEDDNGRAQRWLAAIEKADVAEVDEASRFAELAYSGGHFDQAARWLQRAPANDPRALWIRGKLALMKGDTRAAERDLLRAQSGYPREQGADSDSLMIDGAVSGLSGATANAYRVSQFYGDLGAAQLARDHYLGALTSLYKGAFFEDAAYVAERVLSSDELLAYTRKRFPEPTGKFGEGWGQYEPRADSVAFSLRYLLARRLARGGYFKDARAFYPPELLPVFDRYTDLLRKGGPRSGLPKAARAQALWEAAQIHRVLGMELFGMEGEPDSAIVGGEFPPTAFIKPRLGYLFGRLPDEDDEWNTTKPSDIVPSPTADERASVRQNRLRYEDRFQYRYAAADLAWKAAALMPNKSEDTARVLGIAGNWLQERDPQKADRFYKAMIWRNWSTPLARAADEKRWFPEIEWSYDPWAAAGAKPPEGL